MKHSFKFGWMLVLVALLGLTSCLSETGDPSEQGLPSNVATLQEQVEAMKSSLIEVETLQSSLSEISGLEEYASQFETCATSIKEHIASVEAGLSGTYAATVAMKIQAKVAEAAGTLKAKLALAENEDFNKDIRSVENSVAAWLGKDFKNLVFITSEVSRLRELLKVLDSQSIATEALTSDVEAGLRVGDASQLGSVAESVAKNLETITKLNAKLAALNVEIEQTYTDAIKSQTSSTKSTLKSVNTRTATALADAETTLSGLISRIAACETAIAELKERLTLVETDIKNLLGMIQSLTFLSEFSEEKAIAYYNLSTNEDSDYPGKKFRTRKGSIELNYLVRPASAVTALADMDAWAENGVDVKVQAYYAEQVATKSFDKEFFEMEISAVEASAETGVLKLTVSDAAIDKSFYMKETGAKVALSLKAGNTDVASKFVEIIPKDESNTVYLESFSLASDYITLKTGTTAKIEPIYVPADATVLGYTHDFSDEQTMVIGEDGTIDARATGTFTINLTTNGVNEWGQNLTVECTVKIEPNIQIISPGSVEVGSTAEFRIDAPEDVKLTMQNITWRMKDKNDGTNIDYNAYAGIQSSDSDKYLATITGIFHSHDEENKTYNDVYVICEIDGTAYESTLKVLYKQPRAIIIKDAEGNNWNENSLTLKLNETSDILEASRLSLGPDGVDASKFRINTVVEKDGAAVAAIDANNNHILTGSSFKSGTGIVGNATIKVMVTSDYGELFVGSPTRYIYLKVEPYWVNTISFPSESITMEPEETMTLTPTFTSDVDGKQPSYPVVRWSSSNENVAKVDAETGEITAVNAGPAVITATASHEYHECSLPEGADPISASFDVVVEEAQLTFNIGDIYYSDGTISSTRDYTKTPIGIIFADANAWSQDTRMQVDGLSCTHGLVVGLKGMTDMVGSSFMGTTSSSNAANWVNTQYGYNITEQTKCQGYANTYYLNLFADNKSLSSAMFYDADDDGIVDVVDEYGVSTPTDKGASQWYVPSFMEMGLLKEQISTVNKMIKEHTSGDEIVTGLYWLSSFQDDSWSGIYGTLNAYNLSDGSWNSTISTNESVHNVRLIFAF